MNFGWSYLFFGRQQIGVALVEIVILLVAILVTMGAFWRRDRIASLLFIPYAAWVGFATLLNAAICQLNHCAFQNSRQIYEIHAAAAAEAGATDDAMSNGVAIDENLNQLQNQFKQSSTGAPYQALLPVNARQMAIYAY